eukprot:624053-Pyramimonas_sp.AAC.1
MAVGKLPYQRHDGISLANSTFLGDQGRADMAGCSVRVRAACLQVRGDWSWMKQAFGMTGWRGEGHKKSVCWMCSANTTDRDFRRCDEEAPWRAERHSHESYLRAAENEMRFVSTIFSWPGFQLSYVSVDLMHVGDLGSQRCDNPTPQDHQNKITNKITNNKKNNMRNNRQTQQRDKQTNTNTNNRRAQITT